MDFPPIAEQERSPFLVRRKAVESKESRSIHNFIETTGSGEARGDTSESNDGNKRSTTVSDWGVGWQTPSIIGGAFTLGILNPGLSLLLINYELIRDNRCSGDNRSCSRFLFLSYGWKDGRWTRSSCSAICKCPSRYDTD